MRKMIWGILLASFFLPLNSHADYDQELNDQAAKLKKDFPLPNPEYFHDAGILVYKSDDAKLYEITAGMVRSLLMLKMKEYVVQEWDQINELYLTDPFQAGRRREELVKAGRYYEPTESFLQTSLGQAILTELIQSRTRALASFKGACSNEALIRAITAVRQTGVFMTKSAAEIESLRALDKALACCMGWKPEIHFSREDQFETDYEAGTLTEEGKLRLESSRADLSAARWTGEFIYRFTGRDGQGQGVSQAILIFNKGEDRAKLNITTSRVSSTGRMNFPRSFSGEARTLEVEGNPINPSVRFFGESVPLTGCGDMAK